jgi:hypothetical protein
VCLHQRLFVIDGRDNFCPKYLIEREEFVKSDFYVWRNLWCKFWVLFWKKAGPIRTFIDVVFYCFVIANL